MDYFDHNNVTENPEINNLTTSLLYCNCLQCLDL